MRIVFTSWAWTSHLYPMVPLAWAARTAGHEVLVLTQPALVGTALRAGLPVAAVGQDYDIAPVMRRFTEAHSPLDPRAVEAQRRKRRGGPLNVFGQICEAMLDGLLDACRAWRPDVIVHDPTTYAGPLAAAVLGVPAVRHIWGVDFQATVREYEPDLLAPFQERLGLPDHDPRGALTIDPCPASLQIESDDRRHRVRHLPYNGTAVLPRWLLRPPDRPRICVSWGTTSGTFRNDAETVHRVLTAVAGLDVEVVAALSAGDSAALAPLPDNVRVGPVPLHMLLPSCSLVVNQGGAGTVMTAVAAGVPQLVAPRLPDQVLNADRLAGAGAGLRLAGGEPAEVLAAVRTILDAPEYAAGARALAAECAAQPAVGTAVEALAGLSASSTSSAFSALSALSAS
jgi:UDP:flavonoid glycosyltransferase YjiC (YdhE family)